MTLTREQQLAIIEVKEKFNAKIQDYNNKYTKEEQARFSDKRLCAQTVVDGGTDMYIKTLANAKGTTELEMAQYILSKVEEFKVFFANEEIKKDIEIYNITNNIV